MKFALFVAIQKSPATHADGQRWQNFVGRTRNHAPPLAGITALSDSTFLIQLNAGLNTLASFLTVASEYRIESQVLFFDQEPSFVVTPPGG